MNPLIGIIVPVYKVEDYLMECIDSMINQTYQNIEVILVDDGSPDHCSEICDYYKKIDERIFVIHKKNEGVVKARTKGVEMSSAEYITFCDGDDKFALRAIEKCIEIINKYNPDIVCFGYSKRINNFISTGEGTYYSKKDIINKIYPYLFEDENGKYFPPSLWGKIFKKNLYIDNQLKNKKVIMGEDIACSKPSIYNANSIYIMSDELYFYRTNYSSATLCHRELPLDGPKIIGEHIESKIEITNDSIEMQLYRMVTHQLFIVIKSQFNKKEGYYSTCKEIKKTLLDPYYMTAVDRCYYKKNWKGKFACYILRHHYFFLIWALCKLEIK